MTFPQYLSFYCPPDTCSNVPLFYNGTVLSIMIAIKKGLTFQLIQWLSQNFPEETLNPLIPKRK